MALPSAHPTFLQHYIAYMSSPLGLIAVLSVLCIALSVFPINRPQRRNNTALSFPGCARLGLRGRSNLGKERNNRQDDSSEPRVQALYAYPIKSCRGVELQTAEVTKTGLKYDRLFSFAHLIEDKEAARKLGPETEPPLKWRFITQRERPQLACITTELFVPDPRQQMELLNADESTQDQDAVDDWATNRGCLVVRFPSPTTRWGMSRTELVTFTLPLYPTSERAVVKGYSNAPMSIWKDSPLAINITSEIEPATLAKLKSFLGIERPFALFRIDDNDNLRTITRSLPKDRLDQKFEVGFADAFPVSLLNTASVQAVDDFLPRMSRLKAKLSPLRFRANIYVSGASAFAEDQWKRIMLGQAGDPGDVASDSEFHVACRTARCALPNVDPESGLRDREEPQSTLKKNRVVDEGAKPHAVLGLSMIPLFKRGWLKVGDQVEVIESGEHVYEKMFK